MVHKNKSLSGIGMFLLMVALLIAPEFAYAQLSFFDPVVGDKSISQFLRPLFGSLFGGGASNFEGVIGIFNGAILTIGGIMVAYTLIAGTMQTAHDGEMLGKRWSSMWIPIRTALGVSLVVPINGGYCVAQMLVAWMVTQGVGLADIVWSRYTGLTFTSQGMAPRSPLPAVETLAKGLLRSHTCMAAHNTISTRARETNNLYTENAISTGITFGSRNGLGGECGSLINRPNPTVVVSPGLTDPFGVSITGPELQTIVTAVNAAHVTASTALSASMRTIAQGIVNGTPTSPATMGQFQTAIETYQTTVTQAAANAVQSNNNFAQLSQSAAQDGWIMAGAWFMRAVSLQDAVSTRVSQTASTTAPSSFNSSQEQIKIYYARMESFLNYTPNTFGINNEAAARNDGGDEGSSAWSGIKRSISEFMLNLSRHLSTQDPARHPLMALKDFGDGIMTASITGLGAGIVLLGLAGATVLGTGATVAATLVGNVLMLFLIPLFAFGAGIAVYLPFVPFIIFFGAALGWLLIVAEAIIAAPMWAVMHLSPNGDDLMGSAKQGYMLILGLMLRPALMIFGLICALLAVETVIRVFNYVFFPTMRATMGDSLVGLGSLIAMVAIYFGTMVSLFHKLFGLIHLVPDQIMRWIGGDNSNLGSTAEGIQRQGQGQMVAAVGAVTAGGQRMGGLTAETRNMMNNSRSAQEQQRSSEMQAKQMQQGAQSASREALSSAMESSGRADSSGKMSDRFDSMTGNQGAADKLTQKAEALEQIAQNRNTPKDQKANLMQEASQARSEAAKFQTAADNDYGALVSEVSASTSTAQSIRTPENLAAASAANSLGSRAAALRGNTAAAESFRDNSVQFASQAQAAQASMVASDTQPEPDLQFPPIDGQTNGGGGGGGGPTPPPPPPPPFGGGNGGGGNPPPPPGGAGSRGGSGSGGEMGGSFTPSRGSDSMRGKDNDGRA